MVRIQERSGGGVGEFGGRQGSKDMRESADTRDREKPRTVANMRERDRTLRYMRYSPFSWFLINLPFSQLYIHISS